MASYMFLQGLNKQRYHRKVFTSRTKEDMLLYVWGHAYDIDINEDWDNFEEILKTLSNSRDLIFVKNKELLNI